MGTRPAQSQRFHDIIIQTLNNVYMNRRDTEEVFINPGDEKKHGIKGLYPDVIVKTKTGMKILEVETEETVSETEVVQWKQFFAMIGPFYLIIPSYTEKKASDILKKNGLTSVTIISYKWKDNKLVFNRKLP